MMMTTVMCQGPAFVSGRAGATVWCSSLGQAIWVRCRVLATRDDSGDHYMQGTKELRRQSIHPDFETHGQSHPKSETEGTSGPRKRTSVQQKL